MIAGTQSQSIEGWWISEAEHSNLLALDMEWVPDRSLVALGTSGGWNQGLLLPVQTQEQKPEQQSGLDSDCSWR